MRIISVIIPAIAFLFLSTSISATDYTFTGNGAWSDPANWAGGIIPPQSLSSGNTITINGTAITTDECCDNDFESNYGTVTISADGSLTLQNATQFENHSSIIILGALINRTTFEAYSTGSITIYGNFTNQNWTGPYDNVGGLLGNQGLITIEGGTFDNTGELDNDMDVEPGQIIVNCGGAINNTGIFKPGNTTFNCGTGINNSGGTLSGTATINGNLSNSGTLAPGNSPGDYTVTGDYTASGTAIHNFEVAGTSVSTYDRLLCNGAVTPGGTLNVSLVDGFIPTTDHDLTIITGTINGTFSTVNIPGTYALVYNNNSIVLRHSASLPVNFVSLEVKKEGNGVNLTWKVADEQNVLRYDIEKSIDGRVFAKIGTVNAFGQNQYNFTDPKIEVKCLYRIKSVDYDEKYKYSSIVNFKQGNAIIDLKVFPVPARQEIIVQHKTASPDAKLILTSIEGKMIKIILPTPGMQQTSIDINILAPGSYILQFEDETRQTKTIKFVKQ
jgi:hypothetical protein